MCFVKLLAVISIVAVAVVLLAVAYSALAIRIAGHYMSE